MGESIMLQWTPGLGSPHAAASLFTAPQATEHCCPQMKEAEQDATVPGGNRPR